MNKTALVNGIIQWYTRHRRLLIVVITALTALLIICRFTMERVALSIITQHCHEIEQREGIRIEFDHFGISYLSTIELQGLRVIPSPNDTLLTVRQLAAKINLLPLLSGRIDIGRMEANDILFLPTKRADYCNYHFLTHHSSESTLSSHEKNPPSLSKRISNLLRFTFGILPSSFDIRSCTSIININGNVTHIKINNITSNTRGLHSLITIKDSTSTQQFSINGKINKRNRSLNIELSNTDERKPLHIPYIENAFQAKISFNKLRLSMEVQHTSSSRCEFTSTFQTNDLSINYWRLADSIITPGNLEINAICRIEKNHAQLVEGSEFTFNGFSLTPTLHIDKTNNTRIRLSIDQRDIDAHLLIKALPKGLFSTLESIKVAGTFDFQLLTEVDLTQPDSLILDASITNEQIVINHLGDLARLTTPFLHHVYDEKGSVNASFWVDANGTHGLPLDAISPLLQNAILQSEDGNFYHHKGFSEKHFREAMIENLRQHRFVRGGSTITMQLVKNLFLNRNKNIFRKAEEIALTWIIENKQIANKRHLYQTYLNIIEWGPGIYGANDAAQFYFAKPTTSLTMDEAIFMACIIPNPKKFYWWFDSNGHIKENRIPQLRQVAWLLTRHSNSPINPNEYKPHIILHGPALNYLRSNTADSIPEGLPEEIESSPISIY